jgi:signal transduction histidine kinase
MAELALIEAKEVAEHARQEEERRREIAESLRDVLALLNSNRPLSQVLDSIVIEASKRLNSPAVAIYCQEDGHDLALQAAYGPVADSEPAGVSAILSSLSKRNPVAVSDVLDAETQLASSSVLAPYSALLAVPIDVQDRAYGGILLYYTDSRSFTDDEIELASLFGDQVALAIENARLREEVQEVAVAGERNRLARELHDAVTQTLFSASVIAESLPRIWERYPEEAKRGLEELQQLTRGALAEMRALLLELRPTALTEKPLGELIRNLTEAMVSRTRVPVSLDILHDEPPPPEIQVVCYRIAQETLNNVSKHAAATQVEIALSSKADRVSLTIQDNGAGFDLDESRPGHLGLGIMQERAQRIGAQLTIDSAKGQGTSVTLLWQEGEKE